MASWFPSLVLVFGVLACGKGPGDAASAVVEGCDATHDPTPAAAYAQYLAQGGEPVDAPELVLVLYDKKPTDRFMVIYDPGPHQPTPLLGTVFQCGFYRDAAKLARAMVLDAGWATATVDVRKQIALDTDWIAFGRGLNRVPTNWSADHAFHAPSVVALPDGGIEITQWRNHPKVISYRDGSHENIYVRERRTYAADGSVSEVTNLASYNAGEPKHDFRSGSLR
jgi:hypothetical protein